MGSKSKKVKYISILLSDYQTQKVEYLANREGVTPEFIIRDMERIIERLLANRSGEEFIQLVNCIKIEKLKQNIEKKKKDIIIVKEHIKELEKRLKEYEEDYIAIIELNKALDNLLKVERGN